MCVEPKLNVKYFFQAPSAESKKKWVHDIQAILNTQTKMMEGEIEEWREGGWKGVREGGREGRELHHCSNFTYLHP